MIITLQPDPYSSIPAATAPAESGSVWHHMSGALHESMIRVLSLLISLLPGLLAFIIALAVMTAVGMLLSFLFRKALTATNFDQRLGNTQGGIADFSPGHSPTALVGRIAFWACVVLGLAIGVSAFDASYASTSALSVSLVPYLTRSIGSILLLFAGNLLARYLARTVLIGAVNNQLYYARFLSMGVKWLVMVLTAAMVLDHLQIGGTVVELAFGILFGGIVLTLALAVGLGSRDLVSRSLERNAERPGPSAVERPAEKSDVLRHF